MQLCNTATVQGIASQATSQGRCLPSGLNQQPTAAQRYVVVNQPPAPIKPTEGSRRDPGRRQSLGVSFGQAGPPGPGARRARLTREADSEHAVTPRGGSDWLPSGSPFK